VASDMEIQFAQKAIITHAGQILLIQKNFQDPYQPLKWEVPGGRLREEETLDESIRREVEEEVGIDIEPGPPLSIWSWRLGPSETAPTVIAVARYCKPLSDRISLHGHDDEDHIQSREWIPIEKVPSLDLIPNDRKPILSALELARRLKIA
jgi:8-oxo-dGTP pyrophosphatase MutT (NUDIX family)